MPASLSRRHLLARSSAAGFFMIAGQWVWLTPREAEARAFEPQISPEQSKALSTLGDALVPGVATAGLAAYTSRRSGRSVAVDRQISRVDTLVRLLRAAADNVIAITGENRRKHLPAWPPTHSQSGLGLKLRTICLAPMPST